MKWLFLLRAFFPAWSFFTEPTPEIRLEVLSNNNSWFKLLPEIKRGLKNLIGSAQNNYLHACHNSLLHLVTDISELENPNYASLKDLTSYKIVKNLVMYELKNQNKKLPSIQFRILLVYPYYQEKPREEILVSPKYEVNP